MITLKATANDIERALRELHQLASTGNDNDARNAGQFLMALWNGDRYPLNITEFQYLTPQVMRQALLLLTFLMTTGTSLKKFMSEDAAQQVADNLGALNNRYFSEVFPDNYPHDAGTTRAFTPPPSRLLTETATR